MIEPAAAGPTAPGQAMFTEPFHTVRMKANGKREKKKSALEKTHKFIMACGAALV
jgi:hypothetical protein